MVNESIPNQREIKENTVIGRFLDNLDQELFSALFEIFAPQLVFFSIARA
jgi:hypothetical protein